MRVKGQSAFAYQQTAIIINRLAETIDDDQLRLRYLAAGSIQTVLEQFVA